MNKYHSNPPPTGKRPAPPPAPPAIKSPMQRVEVAIVKKDK